MNNIDDRREHESIIKDAIEKYGFLTDWYSKKLRLHSKAFGARNDLYYSISEIVALNSEGFNIYTFPNKIPKGRGNVNDASVLKINYLFVDMDFKQQVYANTEAFIAKIKEFLEPTIIIHTGNGLHVYWKISDITVSEFKQHQQRLAIYLKTDNRPVNPSRIMRLPYTFNVKDPNNKKLCYIMEYNPEAVYVKSDFDRILPLYADLIIKPVGRPKKLNFNHKGKVFSTTEQPLPAKYLKLIKIDPVLEKLRLSKTKVTRGSGVVSDSKSTNTTAPNDLSLARILLKYVFSINEIFAVLCTSRTANTYRGRNNRRIAYVERTINKALLVEPYYYDIYKGKWD